MKWNNKTLNIYIYIGFFPCLEIAVCNRNVVKHRKILKMFFCSFNDEQQKVQGEKIIIELKEYNLLRENLNLMFDLCAQEKKVEPARSCISRVV